GYEVATDLVPGSNLQQLRLRRLMDGQSDEAGVAWTAATAFNGRNVSAVRNSGRSGLAPSTQGRRKRPKFEASDSRRVFGLALLPHELWEVVVAARGLAGGPGHLPSAEGLHADDGSGRCARGAVRVEDTGLDLGEEAPQFARFSGKDPSGEPVVDVVRDLDRVLESIDLDHGTNWDEPALRA